MTYELKTRQPSGKPSWPLILLAGAEKTGKTYAAAALSASTLIDRTFWIEVGEGSADLYGALPGARYEIVEHDGSFNNIGLMARLATEQPIETKPHLLVIDSMTEVWDMLADEQQLIANRRAADKGRRSASDATITMDQWNAAKKRWRRLLDVLRQHNGPVVLITRLEQVSVVGPDGKPTTEKTWKIRAEKNLPFDVEVIVEMPRPREAYLTGVRSLKLQVPPGEHVPYPDFTLDGLLRDMGFGEVETSPRSYVGPDPEAYADSVGGVERPQAAAAPRTQAAAADRSSPAPSVRPTPSTGGSGTAATPATAPVTASQRPEPAAAPSGDGPATAPQMRAMATVFGRLGITDRIARLDAVALIIGHPVASANELTAREASALLDTLAKYAGKENGLEAFGDYVDELARAVQNSADGATAAAAA